MMTAEFIQTSDPRWKSVLGRARHDFYHTPAYLEVCSRYEGGEAAAFWAEDDKGCFLLPLLRRKIPPSLGASDDWWDLTTPYGYTSPLLHDGESGDLGRFMEQFVTACAESGCVSAFLRLHPLLTLPVDTLSLFGNVLRHGHTVFMDLGEEAETLSKGIRENHRRDIKKLKSRGFTIELDAWNRLNSFVSIYSATMRRLGATSFYFFPVEYFRHLQQALPENLHLCTVLSPEGEVASAGLFAGTDRIVEYHLGGTAQEYLPEAPSKLMFDYMWRWAKEEGFGLFHLGGGLGCRTDSLFRFKEGFSDRRAEFGTVRIIVDQEKYAYLLQARRNEGGMETDFEDDDFFPIYRRPLRLAEAGNS